MSILKFIVLLLLYYLLLPFSLHKLIVRNLIFPSPKCRLVPKIGKDTIITYNNDDRTIKALFSEAGQTLAVIFHGSNSTIKHEKKMARFLYKNQVSTLIMEYPGYGISSESRATEKKIYSDAEALIMHMQDKYGFKPENIHLIGRSIGTGVAVEMASRNYGKNVVLISAMTSMIDIAQRFVPNTVTKELLVDRFENLKKAHKVKKPVLLIHSSKDMIVPYRMSLILRRKFKDARLITVETRKHRPIYDDFNSQVWNDVISFINR